MITHCVNSPPADVQDFCRVTYMYFDHAKKEGIEDVIRIPML